MVTWFGSEGGAQRKRKDGLVVKDNIQFQRSVDKSTLATELSFFASVGMGRLSLSARLSASGRYSLLPLFFALPCVLNFVVLRNSIPETPLTTP